MTDKRKIKEKTVHFHILISPTLLEKLKEAAEREEMPVSTLARSWIIEKLKELEK